MLHCLLFFFFVLLLTVRLAVAAIAIATVGIVVGGDVLFAVLHLYHLLNL